MLKVTKAPTGTLSKPKVKANRKFMTTTEDAAAGRQDTPVRVLHVRNFNQSLLAQYLKQSVLK